MFWQLAAVRISFRENTSYQLSLGHIILRQAQDRLFDSGPKASAALV
jgi:hypothetical protein